MEGIIKVCIEEAEKAFRENEVPIGAVLVQNGQIIAKSHNSREKEHDILGHAEINVIIQASNLLKRWNLSDCEIYVTLKPCSMCEEVIKQSRIKSVYYLLDKLDYKKEFSKTNFKKITNYHTETDEQMYLKILKDFFSKKR